MSAAAASINGSSASASAKTAASSMAPSGLKNQLKATSSGKALGGARKQASSPVDASASKKPAAPKTWQGTNPITQRSTSTASLNGVSNGPGKNTATASAKTASSTQPKRNTADKHANERLLFLVANFAGLAGRVTGRNGEQFEGIFSAASLDAGDSRFFMKMVKRISPATSPPSNTAEKLNELIGNGEDHIVAFNFKDIIDLNVSDVQLAVPESKSQNGAGPSFRTDAEISGSTGLREKELQPWQAGPETDVDLSLDSSAIGTWDQFATNEKLYNVRSDYDENLYTTSIDRSDPRYREREARAARIAKEINASEAANSHVAEERRMNANPDAGLDEEDKYSGVRRDFNPLPQGRTNAYVPPSRRPITSQPTVSGAPFDPAIISAQISRPAPPVSTNSDKQTPVSSTPKDSSTPAAPVVAVAKPPITVTEAAGPSKPTAAATQKKASERPTEGVEQKLLDSFKQFSVQEKLRVQAHHRAVQERNRTQVRQEKSVKLNDLKKFAENFKLYSRVPDDLVPILAKTKEKQTEIVSKAEQQALEKEHRVKTTPATTPIAPSKTVVDILDKSARATPAATGRPDTGNDATSSSNNRQRITQNQSFRASTQAMPSPRGPAPVNHRAQPTPPQHRANVPGPLPMTDLRSPPTGPSQMRGSDSGLMSPDSAASTRFNVKAMEFRPNPAASNFTPGPAKASPQESKRPSVSTTAASAAANTPPQFFSSNVKAPSERTRLADAFNPIKRLAEKAATDAKIKDMDLSANGGIPQAYRTPPTWECPAENKDKSYTQAFPQSLPVTTSPMPTPTNGGIPHQYQLPLHMQNVPPPIPSAQQTPRFNPAQPHQFANQHIDDHRMQYASSNSSVQPSPRMGHPAMAYNGQMHPQMQNFPGAMPAYAMSPASMQMRPMPAGPPFGPQGPQMGGHMMMQQPSNGPFMNGPMGQQMYPSPGPGHVQPHFAGHPQQPGAGGPYNPGPRGHPMSHQGSQQGHQAGPPMYMAQPGAPMMMQQHPGQMAAMRNYPQQQYQGGPHAGYPMQHRQMSGGGFNSHQMTPRQHHAAPQQGGPSGNVPPMHGGGPGDEGK